jgi:integrase
MATPPPQTSSPARFWPSLTSTRINSASRRTHDLRHTGNLLTASAGASLRELMARMGHASTRAALVYLHDTEDRQRAIAAAVSDLAARELGQLAAPPDGDSDGRSGT